MKSLLLFFFFYDFSTLVFNNSSYTLKTIKHHKWLLSVSVEDSILFKYIITRAVRVEKAQNPQNGIQTFFDIDDCYSLFGPREFVSFIILF